MIHGYLLSTMLFGFFSFTALLLSLNRFKNNTKLVLIIYAISISCFSFIVPMMKVRSFSKKVAIAMNLKQVKILTDFKIHTYVEQARRHINVVTNYTFNLNNDKKTMTFISRGNSADSFLMKLRLLQEKSIKMNQPLKIEYYVFEGKNCINKIFINNQNVVSFQPIYNDPIFNDSYCSQFEEIKLN